MRNIKLKIQYDGTDYHGWQIQKNDITVQETVTMYATFSQIQEYRLKNCRMR